MKRNLCPAYSWNFKLYSALNVRGWDFRYHIEHDKMFSEITALKLYQKVFCYFVLFHSHFNR